MERRLHDATIAGSISSLQLLLHEDPLVLDRFLTASFLETPLHIAAMLGHLEFAKEILKVKPELIVELDSRRSTALHLASAKGYVEMVKLLVNVNPRTCHARDRYGRNPVHVAAIKGRVGVLKELVRARPDAARSPTERGDTILHLCVKHNQLEALKLLAEIFGDEDEFVRSQDCDGNTALHLAVIDKQLETIKFLVTTAVDLNVQNANGLTALDILELTQRDSNYVDIGETLRHAGALKSNDNPIQQHQNGITTRRRRKKQKSQKHKSKNDDWLERWRGAVMVIGSLIAAMAFQAGLNPPGGVWQDFLPDSSAETTAAPPLQEFTSLLDITHLAGRSVMAEVTPDYYSWFLIANTMAFIASLSAFLLLLSGLPCTKSKVFVYILKVLMWVSSIAISNAYLAGISITAPPQQQPVVVMLTWMMAVINLFVFSVYLWYVWRLLKILGRLIRRLRGRRPFMSRTNVSGSHV